MRFFRQTDIGFPYSVKIFADPPLKRYTKKDEVGKSLEKVSVQCFGFVLKGVVVEKNDNKREMN